MATQALTRKYRKLSPELIEKLCGYIANGSYAVTACAACGIDESTLYIWQKKAQADRDNGNSESLENLLVKSLQKAEAIAEHQLASMIRETALDKREWLPAMTFLERRHPERWGRKDRLQVDQQKKVTVSVIVKHYDEELPAGDSAVGQIIEGEVKELPEGVGNEV